MMLRRWEPFGTMRHAMDRLWDEEFFRPLRLWHTTWEEEGWVPLDVYHTKEAVVVKAALPGVKPEEVDITIEDNRLSIRGEVKAETERTEKDYLLRERRFASFRRVVRLPRGLNPDKAEATFENGSLTLTIPKAEETRTKSIKVKAHTPIEGTRK